METKKRVDLIENAAIVYYFENMTRFRIDVEFNDNGTINRYNLFTGDIRSRIIISESKMLDILEYADNSNYDCKDLMDSIVTSISSEVLDMINEHRQYILEVRSYISTMNNIINNTEYDKFLYEE